MIKTTDSMGFKNYYNGHKAEIEKELDFISKLEPKKSEVIEVLTQKKEETIAALKTHFKSKLQFYGDLEKLIDQHLPVLPDKDQKKCLVFHFIYKHSESLVDLVYTHLIQELEE